MLARASTKTFVSRVQKTAEKIFVSRKIRTETAGPTDPNGPCFAKIRQSLHLSNRIRHSQFLTQVTLLRISKLCSHNYQNTSLRATGQDEPAQRKHDRFSKWRRRQSHWLSLKNRDKRSSRNINLGTRLGCVVVTYRPLSARERAPVPITQVAGWTPWPVWTVLKSKSLALTKFEIRTVRHAAR